jgi:hypothetical protein
MADDLPEGCGDIRTSWRRMLEGAGIGVEHCYYTHDSLSVGADYFASNAYKYGQIVRVICYTCITATGLSGTVNHGAGLMRMMLREGWCTPTRHALVIVSVRMLCTP